MEQLTTDIGATDISLNNEVLEGIQQVYRRYPMPF
jgi:aryl-alcohol dehydrogenase-like predicted oxidoreductase